jgi:Fe2+ or Zn2+ uptake regulation protein
MPDTTPWTATLDEAGYFVTERRRVVAKMVADSDSLFTANELVAEAKAARLSVGRATVFGRSSCHRSGQTAIAHALN